MADVVDVEVLPAAQRIREYIAFAEVNHDKPGYDPFWAICYTDAPITRADVESVLAELESARGEVRLHRQQRADVLDVLQIRAEEMHEALPTSLAERAIRFGDFNVSARDVRAALGDIP